MLACVWGLRTQSRDFATVPNAMVVLFEAIFGNINLGPTMGNANLGYISPICGRVPATSPRRGRKGWMVDVWVGSVEVAEGCALDWMRGGYFERVCVGDGGKICLCSSAG